MAFTISSTRFPTYFGGKSCGGASLICLRYLKSIGDGFNMLILPLCDGQEAQRCAVAEDFCFFLDRISQLQQIHYLPNVLRRPIFTVYLHSLLLSIVNFLKHPLRVLITHAL